MQKKRIALFISGRGSNMQAIAQQVQTGILKDCCEIAVVFSNKASAKGLMAAQKMGLTTACIPSKGKKRQQFDAAVLALLADYKLDYIVLAGYMRILSAKFIQAYPNKIINIHPADTQRHQGLHAYEWAFNLGLSSTKITVHYVNEGVDTGQIIAQASVDLTGVKSLEDVEKRGLHVEHRFYSMVLHQLFTY